MTAAARGRGPALVVGGIAGAQLLALAIFAVAARQLPLNDDWVYSEPARRLATGHGLHLFPEVAVPAIPQIGLGALAWALHPSHSALRLESLLAAAAAVVLVVVLSRRLGARPYWSLLAGACLAVFPVFAGVSAAFMTEPLYLALLLGTAVLGLGWLRDGRRSPWILPLLLAAALDRQHALGIAIALVAAILAMGGGRRKRDDLLLLLACLAATAAGLLFPVVADLATPRMGFRVSTAGGSTLHLVVPAVAYTPRLLGLLTLPFGYALARVAWAGSPARGVVVVSLAAAVLGTASLVLPDGARGTYLTAAGLGPLTLDGDKPLLLTGVLPLLKVLAVAAFTAMVAATYRRVRVRALSPAMVFLVVLALTQAAPMLTFSVYDRYYLPVLVILLPMVAVLPGGDVPSSASAAWAAAALVALGALFVAGQQDYLAWQASRDRLAQEVAAAQPDATLFGGYETYGTYILIPRFEAGMYGGPTGPDLPSFVGPANPGITIEFARRGDPRPGIDYASLAPGRVVMVCRHGPCPVVPGR
ncbi:MAG: hypothetical protein ACR2MY_14145 [Candidatus Dormibacteria bacterium]